MQPTAMTLSDTDYTLFGLPPTYQLDLSALQQAYLKLQNLAHPDRHTHASAQEQRMAMQWTTRINQAYSRLKNPTERAVYWCELHGQNPKAPNTPLSAQQLAQHMEWHETLANLDNTSKALATLEALRQEVQSAQTTLYQQMAQAADHDHNPAAACQHAQALLYMDKFLQQLNNTLARLEDTL